jgi:hypothetical protein
VAELGSSSREHRDMIAAAVSIWFARDAYRKYREAVEDEKKFVVEALSGKFG